MKLHVLIGLITIAISLSAGLFLLNELVKAQSGCNANPNTPFCKDMFSTYLTVILVMVSCFFLITFGASYFILAFA